MHKKHLVVYCEVPGKIKISQHLNVRDEEIISTNLLRFWDNHQIQLSAKDLVSLPMLNLLIYIKVFNMLAAIILTIVIAY